MHKFFSWSLRIPDMQIAELNPEMLKLQSVNRLQSSTWISKFFVDICYKVFSAYSFPKGNFKLHFAKFVLCTFNEKKNCGTLHNHWSDITSNLFQKVTLNMLCSVPCCEVQKFFFFFFLSPREDVGVAELCISKKGNSEYAVLCFLLRGSTFFFFFFFFLALHGKRLGYKNFEIYRSQLWKWYFAQTLWW